MSRKKRNAAETGGQRNASSALAANTQYGMPDGAPVFNTAIYARLSIENSKKNDNGESIENQIEICRAYVDEHPYLRLVQIYTDNGRTGTNTNRPEFQRMLADMRMGKINALVIKDFSRFSRDYVEAGNLLERDFPSMGIRFISVIDNYDSFETDGSTASLLIPLKNLVNAYYSKDISRKVSTAVHTRQDAGEHIPSMIPYGYMKSETRAYRYDVNPETGDVVRRIFSEFLGGKTLRGIAVSLETEGIPSPGRYRFLHGMTKAKEYETCMWSARMVRNILSCPIYCGDLIFGRQLCSLYQSIPEYTDMAEDTWRIHSNTHEALVSREDFERTKEKLNAQAERWHKATDQSDEARKTNLPLFQGLIKCSECGSNLGYHRYRNPHHQIALGNIGNYKCRNARRGHIDSHNIAQRRLVQVVSKAMHEQLQMYFRYERLIADIGSDSLLKNRQAEYENRIRSLISKLNTIRKRREHLYEDFTMNILSPQEYTEFKKKYDDDYTAATAELNETQTRLNRLRRNLSLDNRWLSALREFADADLNEPVSDELIKKLAHALIEEIVVHPIHENHMCEIVWKFRRESDILKTAMEEADYED